MSEEQINIAIAELTGLDVIHDPAGPKDRPEAWKTGFFTPKAAKQRRISWPSSAVIKAVPDYCNDLNAIHEVEITRLGLKYSQWTRELQLVCGRNRTCVESATARQRAEAFLRTLGKWEETK